jgi:hypothetical protein
LSTFRLAYVSDNFGYISRINNLISLFYHQHEILILLQIIALPPPPQVLEVLFFNKGNILPADRIWSLELFHSVRCVYEVANSGTNQLTN